MPDVDFKDVKARFPIMKVAELLGLELKPEQGGRYYRGECPFCQRARTFRITPGANLYGCFSCRDDGVEDCRGDQIQLVQKVKGLKSMLQAAKWLTGDERRATEPVGGTGIEELSLDHSHDDVQLLGLDPADAEKIGIGYHDGQVLVPIRLKSGALVGYIAAVDITLPDRWEFPTEKIVKFQKKTG